MSEDINNFGTLVPKRFVESLVTENARLNEEIERLNADKKHTHLFPPVIESKSIPDGQAVLVNIYQHRNDADEIKLLKAEVEAYKRHYEFMKGQAMERFSEICRQDEEIQRLSNSNNEVQELKQRLNRLISAGDNLVGEGETMAHDVSWHPSLWHNLVTDWESAKL